MNRKEEIRISIIEKSIVNVLLNLYTKLKKMIGFIKFGLKLEFGN